MPTSNVSSTTTMGICEYLATAVSAGTQEDIEHKKLEFSLAKDGTIGLESLFGTVNSVLDIETTIKALTINPRAIFGQESITIEKDTVANLTLFNPEGISVFSKENILSTSKNSAFTGKELKGKVYGIFANKKLVLN